MRPGFFRKKGMRYTAKQKKELIELICNKIADEKLSLRATLRLEGMPSRDTFFRWIDKTKKYADQYARACEERADAIFEEILDIADDDSEDVLISEKGKAVFNKEFAARSKIRIDARKWNLSKMNPKKYGDYQKIDMDVTEVKPILTKRTE